MSKKPTPSFTVMTTSKPQQPPTQGGSGTLPRPPELDPTCGACTFYRVMPGGSGFCHRYPTAVRKDSTSFCGEYKPK